MCNLWPVKSALYDGFLTFIKVTTFYWRDAISCKHVPYLFYFQICLPLVTSRFLISSWLVSFGRVMSRIIRDHSVKARFPSIYLKRLKHACNFYVRVPCAYVSQETYLTLFCLEFQLNGYNLIEFTFKLPSNHPNRIKNNRKGGLTDLKFQSRPRVFRVTLFFGGVY